MENKRRSNREIIESQGAGEHVYVKAPRGELVDVSEGRYEKSAKSNITKEFEFWRTRGGKKGTFLHTHPYRQGFIFSAFPSPADIPELILRSSVIKTGTIAQTDYKTGGLMGYTNIHLKPRTKVWKEDEIDIEKAVADLEQNPNFSSMSAGEYHKELLKMGKEHGFDIRFHPARGHYFDKNTGNYEKKSPPSLERIAASILIGFTLLFLLAKVPLTGNMISNSALNNYIGVWFIIVGLFVSLVIYFGFRRFNRKGIK